MLGFVLDAPLPIVGFVVQHLNDQVVEVDMQDFDSGLPKLVDQLLDRLFHLGCFFDAKRCDEERDFVTDAFLF